MTLSIIAPSGSRGIDKHTVIYSDRRILLSHRKEHTLIHTEKQMNIKNVMLSERSQTQKRTFYKMTVVEPPRPANSVYDGTTQSSSGLWGGERDSQGRSPRKFSGSNGSFCIGIGVWMALGSCAFATIDFSAFPQKEIILKGWRWDTLQLFFKRMRQLWTDLKRLS